MLPVVCIAWLSMLPSSGGIVNCRIACRRCRERLEHPDMLEVYCAMCDECKERRREWLDGAPDLLKVGSNSDYLTNYGHQELQDECPTTPADEYCDQPPQLLTQTLPTSTTTAATTSTTTTSTTTSHKPCPPTPCRTTRAPCHGIPCPLPMAIPVCAMCPVQMTGSFYTVTPPSELESNIPEVTDVTARKLSGLSTTSELYLYLGVPKRLLKQLQLTKS